MTISCWLSDAIHLKQDALILPDTQVRLSAWCKDARKSSDNGGIRENPA